MAPEMWIIIEPPFLPNIKIHINGDVIATAILTHHVIKVIHNQSLFLKRYPCEA